MTHRKGGKQGLESAGVAGTTGVQGGEKVSRAMSPTKGFYSVIQFCPDLDRGECANVGVVLMDPERRFLDVRMSDDNEGPKQRFGRDAYDEGRLHLAKTAIANRLRHEGPEWTPPDQLQRFGSLEGNNLILSPPKVILVDEPEQDLQELYERLVHVQRRERRRQPKPDLAKVFDKELAGVRLFRDLQVEVPHSGKLRVPYAYQNGRLNLVYPEGFPIKPSAAEEKANELAVKGHLLFKHPDERGTERKLVVVGSFDSAVSDKLRSQIEFLLREHDTDFVPAEQLGQFAKDVAKQAH